MKTSTHEWMPVPGFPRYFINIEGTIKSIQPGRKDRIIKTRLDRAGYVTVRLSIDSRVHTVFIHRLVAQAFVLNQGGGTCVNHKNGNKQDNRADNLEWVSHSGNILHAHRSGLIRAKRQRRIVIDRCKGKRFANVSEAARFYGIPVSTCRQYLMGTLPNPTCLQLHSSTNIYKSSI